MKILIITNHSYMLWRFRRELIQELQKKHEVVLSMPFVGHQDDFKNLGICCIDTDVDRRGINPKTDIKLLKTYQHIIKNEKPDMVITYSIKPNVYAGFVCRLQNVPYFTNVQGLGTAFQKPGLAQFVTMLYKIALRNAKCVFFENHANAEEFLRRHIVEEQKQIVLNGAGINLDYYPYMLYPKNEKVHFLYLGRIMREKGMDELFDAVLKLYEEDEQFVLDLVGFFEEEYETKVKILEEKGIAVFHGFKEDPRPYYEKTDCVILPSYHEGMSNVLLEAAATGRPLITSDIPGCRETVVHRKTGCLVEAKNGDSLYASMKYMLNLSRKEREAMGKAGRTKMEDEFDKEAVVKETMKALGFET